jgi:hypothetical protein
MSAAKVSQLAADIHELVSKEGALETETVRERLTVASAVRFRSAVRELQVGGYVHSSGGVIRLPGNTTARHGSMPEVWRARRAALKAQEAAA